MVDEIIKDGAVKGIGIVVEEGVGFITALKYLVYVIIAVIVVAVAISIAYIIF